MHTSIPPKKRIRLSSIYDRHFTRYLYDESRNLHLENKHLKAINKSKACRTKTLGVAVYECDSCGTRVHIHRSCKHRFCGRCGSSDTIKWANKTLARLMNIKHHHVIMTLPKGLRALSKMNGNLITNLLFRSSSVVVQRWFTKKHGIKPGIVSVLHTSGSDLKYHPHVHMIVSGGGRLLAEDGYVELSSDYLTNQKYFGRELQKEMTKLLIQEFRKGNLEIYKRIETDLDLRKWMNKLSEKNWIVSIQKPLDDIHQIVGYVGRYTKRSCLSEYKIKSGGDRIKFQYNDYKNTPKGEKPRQNICEMSPTKFLDSLLQHVPDKGYKAVRYYGMYNSMYMKQIPDKYKVKEELEADYLFEEGIEWGEHEKYRKSQIKRGKSDPLYCSCCAQSMVLKDYEYDNRNREAKEYDSS